MWTPFSTPSPNRARPDLRGRPRSGLLAGLIAVAMAATPAAAQQVVFDPRNHLENALQAARQLESLANEARSLAASPYTHLAANSAALRDMAELARTARGVAGTAERLEAQLRDLYPGDPGDVDIEALLGQTRARAAVARRTAEDVARTAAELERLRSGRADRLAGALSASEAAAGQTAAVQSSNQLLAVLAEDLSALQTLMAAQSRLMAEASARQAADRAAGDAARRARWSGSAASPPAPRFDPFARAAD